MAELNNENIKKTNEIWSKGKINELISSFNKVDGDFKNFKAKVYEKMNMFIEKEKAEKAEKEAAASNLDENSSVNDNTREDKPLDEKPDAEIKADKKAEAIEDKPKATQKAEEVSKSAKNEKSEIKTDKQKAETTKAEDVKKADNVEVSSKPSETVKAENSTPTEKARPSFIVRHEEFVPKNAPKKTFTPSNSQDRPYRDRNNGTRPTGDKPYGERGQKPFGVNGQSGTFRTQNGQGKPMGKKPQNTYIAPPIVPTEDKRTFAKKKNAGEKQYEEKHTLSKRALIRNSVDIDDFDEDKTGYRKFRPVKKAKETAETNVIKIEKAVINTDIIPLKVLSEKIGITAAEITKRLFKEGIMKTINDSVDFDTAAFIADEIGVQLELKLDKTAEDVLSEGFDTAEVDETKLVRRPPVVTVMGHVDHGKTSILDRIRKTNVTAGEAGGITQHIGAYQTSVDGNMITFLDTPGHAAFTAMRARGAQATDIAVLVVAADDGIMPQTEEAISHAKAANVPIIVAINKIDKPEANIERIKTQLTEKGLVPEEWGGDTMLCPVSAKTGEGFDNLLGSILTLAEVRDLKADPTRKAKGVVIEAKLDPGKGPIATILIQNGTLKVGDNVIVGTVTGKIRAMSDDKGRKVSSAGPSVPVSIMGLDEVPEAGDTLYAVEQDKLMKLVAEERKNKERENMIKSASKVTLDEVFSKIAEGEMKVLSIVVKADVQGSVEAVKQSLEKLSNDEVRVSVIHAAVGAIKESDIMLAESSHAIIIGFNVRPDSNAKQIAEKSGVDIKLYRIIYEAIEDVEKALKGMLKPKITETYLGKAEVREVFKISGVGQVAGCYVVEGKIARGGKLRIYRDDVMITEGNVLQLKRFKDDVKEVNQGFECGISIEKFNDIKIGDYIECYDVAETKE